MADDPVADFLAREQDDLAGIEDVAEVVPPPTENNDENMFQPLPTQNGMGGGEDLVNGHLGEEENQPPFMQEEGAGEKEEEEAAPETNKYNISLPRVEPEKIIKWREEQGKRLQSKDAEESKKISDMKTQAQKELAEFNKNRKEQIEKSKKNNRDAEAEFLQERDAERPGKEWERIATLCEFNPKQSKNTKDVSRMRSLLLQMKQAKA